MRVLFVPDTFSFRSFWPTIELLAFRIMRDIHCHADAEDLESYSMGTSSAEETARIEEHLLICEDCRNRLRDGEDYLNSMQVGCPAIAAGRNGRRERGWKFPSLASGTGGRAPWC